MEILPESTSSSTAVEDPTLRVGNPVKEILLKLNLLDHRRAPRKIYTLPRVSARLVVVKHILTSQCAVLGSSSKAKVLRRAMLCRIDSCVLADSFTLANGQDVEGSQLVKDLRVDNLKMMSHLDLLRSALEASKSSKQTLYNEIMKLRLLSELRRERIYFPGNGVQP
ncbi:hypothetical protein Tco_0474156 [Tanacetum coccineum]